MTVSIHGSNRIDFDGEQVLPLPPEIKCVAYCLFDGVNITPINGENICPIFSSANIDRIVRVNTGWYSIYFAAPMPDIYYSPSVVGTGGGTISGYVQLDTQEFNGEGSHDFWTDRFNIRTTDSGGNYYNHPRISIQVFR